MVQNIRSIREMTNEEFEEFIKQVKDIKSYNEKEKALQYIQDIRYIKSTSEVVRRNNTSTDKLKRVIRKAATAALNNSAQLIDVNTDIQVWTSNVRFINAVKHCDINTLQELSHYIKKNGFNIPRLGSITLNEALADYERAAIESGRDEVTVKRDIKNVLYNCVHNDFIPRRTVQLKPIEKCNAVYIKASTRDVNIIPMYYSKKNNVWYNTDCVCVDTNCRIILWCANEYRDNPKNKATVMASLKWKQSDVMEMPGRVFQCKASNVSFIDGTYSPNRECRVVQQQSDVINKLK